MAVLSSRLSHYSNILPLSAPGSLIRVNDAHKVGFIVTFICQCLLWSLSCPRLHTYPHTRLEIINNIKLHRFGVKAFNSGKVWIGTVWDRVRISLIIPMYISLELNTWKAEEGYGTREDPTVYHVTHYAVQYR